MKRMRVYVVSALAVMTLGSGTSVGQTIDQAMKERVEELTTSMTAVINSHKALKAGVAAQQATISAQTAKIAALEQSARTARQPEGVSQTAFGKLAARVGDVESSLTAHKTDLARAVDWYINKRVVEAPASQPTAPAPNVSEAAKFFRQGAALIQQGADLLDRRQQAAK